MRLFKRSIKIYMKEYYEAGDFIIYKIDGKEEKGKIVKFNTEDNSKRTALIKNKNTEVKIPISQIIDFDKKEMDKHKNKCSMQQVLGIIGICLGFIYGIILGCIGLKTGKYSIEDDLGRKFCHLSVEISIFEIIFGIIVGVFCIVNFCC